MRLLLPLLVITILLFSGNLHAQTLSGRVMTEKGAWATGVSVQFKNHRNSIVTNPDGSFKITATSLPDTLVFSSVGFEPYEVIITEKNISDPDFQVVLLERRESLSEVVVMAHARTKKRKAVTSALRIRGSSSPAPASTESYGFSTRPLVGDANTTPPRAQAITAGEVNDFMKWKRWEDYTDDLFRQYSIFWGIDPTTRYSVQVSDKEGKAVVNEPVFLVNKDSGDTTWKAYTDNTGKAELWAGFTAGSAREGFIITDSRGNKVKRPSIFENGMNFLRSDRPCNGSNTVDIAFVVDATGSMGDEIEFLKLELEEVIRKSTEEYKDLGLNTASVFYRDEGDAYVTRHNDFHSDMLKVLNFIKLQAANGGGDTPEAVDQALDVALNQLNWNMSSRTRLLFLVLDAPPHEKKKQEIARLVTIAAAKGIRIIPIACSGIDKSTEFLMRSMALATNGTYTFLTDHSGIGNAHIEPTTDAYNVELLSGLLQRLIRQFVMAQDCSAGNDTLYVNNRLPVNILAVKLFPNPTRGEFRIESNEEIKELYVTDFAGKILMKVPGSGKRYWNADLGNYPAGTYLVKYITKENKSGAEKILLLRN